MKISLDDLLANANTKVIFTLPTGKEETKLEAWMVNDTFEVSGSASYESMFDRGLAKTALETAGFGKIAQAVELGENVLQIRAKHLVETVLSYGGTDRPTFTVELLFVALKANDDPRKKAKLLLEGIFPQEGKEMLLRPPWNYGLTSKEHMGSQKLSVQIGSWFRAPNQVLTSASFQFSRETTRTGVPLFVTGNVQFKPYMQLYDYQIKSYFINTGTR